MKQLRCGRGIVALENGREVEGGMGFEYLDRVLHVSWRANWWYQKAPNLKQSSGFSWDNEPQKE
jgi:hypothetical protein